MKLTYKLTLYKFIPNEFNLYTHCKRVLWEGRDAI